MWGYWHFLLTLNKGFDLNSCKNQEKILKKVPSTYRKYKLQIPCPYNFLLYIGQPNHIYTLNNIFNCLKSRYG